MLFEQWPMSVLICSVFDSDGLSLLDQYYVQKWEMNTTLSNHILASTSANFLYEYVKLLDTVDKMLKSICVCLNNLCKIFEKIDLKS